MENKFNENFCAKINSAIKVSQEYAKRLDNKLSYIAKVMPIGYKPKGTGKWARVYLSTRTTKELKKLKNAFVRYKLKVFDDVATKVDESKMNVSAIEFAINFKELTREAIACKVRADKDERMDWDEILENFDLIGLQISEACEYFESLGRYNYGKKRKQKKDAFVMQNANNLINLVKTKAKEKPKAQKKSTKNEEREQ